MPLPRVPQDEQPVGLIEVFTGYENKIDSTKQNPNSLTAPSQNVLIPTSDKVVPRGDSKQLGQDATGNFGICGHMKKYTNLGGVEMEVRTWKSGGVKRDVVEVLYTNPLIANAVPLWYQITENANPLTAGVNDEYYFADWNDTYLVDSVASAVSLNLRRLIWVDGTSKVKSWTGGVGPIVSLVANTSITTTAGVTWASLGFVDPAFGGTGKVIINGVAHTITGGWATDTLTLASTAGISVNDVAFAQVEEDSTTNNVAVDNLNTTYKNYVVYGNEDKGNFFMSNAFNRSASQLITQAQANQNDLVLGSSNYTGSGRHVYRVSIDKIAEREKRYFLQPAGAVDNLQWITDDYSLVGRNNYTIRILGGATTFQLYKNNVAVGAPQAIVEGTEINLTNGLVMTFVPIIPSGGAYVAGTAWNLYIGGQDSFYFQIDGGAASSSTLITGNTQNTLGSGLQIKFVGVRGHSVGDFWEITVDQAVERAWVNFYYGLPRKPGEGYVGNLPANFWAIAGQEGVTYINTTSGKWVYIDTELSADLLTETVNVKPLKQSSANKVIFPYMITHMENDLAFLNEKKAICTIGRKELVELPQVSNISDLVKKDLLAMSFIKGSMEYNDAKLFMTSPLDQGKMMIYDNAPTTKYWQPPQSIPGLGILSVVGNNLITHSILENVSNEIMLEEIGDGDNGHGFRTIVATTNNTYQDRWLIKAATQTFIEGRMEGNSQFFMDIVACDDTFINTFSHLVVPVLALSQNRASIGAGALGTHPLGIDVPPQVPVFREIYGFRAINFYWAAIILYSDTLGQKWELYSLGMNVYQPEMSNTILVNKSQPVV